MAIVPHGGKRKGAGRKPSDLNGEPRVERIVGVTATEKRLLLEYLERIRREAEEAKRESES